MASRLHKTLTDYVAIAISPALIMTLVGSLVFFLLQIFYRGQFDGRVHYILALFIFAAVLIARISMEEGSERAALFALALAVAVGLAVMRFGSMNWIVAAGFVALIWWCAHKLTWDCTLIDENEDASGEGLLKTAGLDESSGQESAQEEEPEATTGGDEDLLPWWQRYAKKERRPHAPGVWVVYFSLAALPLFGVGSLFLPAGALGSRQYAFNLFCLYVASGLGLLLTTSFLGLRRYLRQRRLEMPSAMAGVWMGSGAALIVALLLVAAILPRPGAEYAISQIPLPKFGSSDDSKSSRIALGKEGVKDEQRSGPADDRERSSQGEQDEAKKSTDEGQAASRGKAQAQGESKAKGESGSRGDARSQKKASDEQADGARDSGKKGGANGKGQNGKAGKDSKGRGAEKSKREGAKSQPPRQATPPAHRPSPPQLPSLLSSIGSAIAALLKWVFYAALLALVAYMTWRYWPTVVAALRELQQALADLWQKLFGARGRVEDDSASDEAAPQPAPLRSFADFSDPFASGVAAQYAPDELVVYTFEAFEAWARQHDCPRGPEQTAYEFSRRVGAEVEPLRRDARILAQLYSQVAYAPGSLPPASVRHLESLWRQLRSRQIEKAHHGVTEDTEGEKAVGSRQ